jgi:hypothetical protein
MLDHVKGKAVYSADFITHVSIPGATGPVANARPAFVRPTGARRRVRRYPTASVEFWAQSQRICKVTRAAPQLPEQAHENVN